MKKISHVFWIALVLMIFQACSQNPQPTPTPQVDDKPLYATGLIKDPNRHYGVMHFIPKNFKGDIPQNFSWIEKGFETPVRNQGNCGSCWAFGGTQTIELGYKIFGNQVIDFSEQDLVGKLYYGCGGGYFTGEFQVSKGQLAEADCAYTASNKKCSTTIKPAGKGISWGEIGQPGRVPTVVELQNAILSYGAISVTVGANGSFSNYKSGLATACPKVGTNHIVALEGWKTVNNKVYFHVKNSWGTGWGEKGYGWFPAGCWNLAEEASWLAVDAVPCKPPVIKVPAEYIINFGDDVVLAVKAQQGVVYSWFNGDQKVGEGNILEITVKESMVLTLKAKNQCGDAEIMTKVTVKN